MKALTLILKHVEYTDEIIHKLAEEGVKGGTILDGTGMASTLMNMEDLPIFGMLRHMIDSDDKDPCKVMIFVLEDEEVDNIKKVIREIIGGFNKPNSGIMFAMPITDVEGFGE